MNNGSQLVNPGKECVVIGDGHIEALRASILPSRQLGRLGILTRSNVVTRIDDQRLVDALSPLVGALPSLAVTGQVAARRLMEVSISGELIGAASGSGYRAFAMGPNGIVEQARLFSVSGLTALATGTALLTVASYLLGQQHLASIRSSLDRLREQVGRIEEFLHDERYAKVESRIGYIEEAFNEVRSGHFSELKRAQLEHAHLEIEAARIHVTRQLASALSQPMRVGKIGSSAENAGLEDKLKRLEELSDELGCCVNALLACWCVTSLHPGDPTAQEMRRDNIRQSYREMAAFREKVGQRLSSEISQVEDWYGSNKSKHRRGVLASRTHQLKSALTKMSREGFARLDQAVEYIDESRKNRRLVAEVRAGKIAALYLVPEHVVL